MKSGTHPNYTPAAKISCACGAVLTVGSTTPSMEVEICSACHPFFTGQNKLIDVAGRVEKFAARRARTGGVKDKKKAVAPKKPRGSAKKAKAA